MHMALTLQTPHLKDYPELVQVWEDSVRATHHFLPDAYILLLREHVLRSYLDAVMLICCKDRQRRATGRGNHTDPSRTGAHQPHSRRSRRAQ